MKQPRETLLGLMPTRSLERQTCPPASAVLNSKEAARTDFNKRTAIAVFQLNSLAEIVRTGQCDGHHTDHRSARLYDTNTAATVACIS
jgi:hypothetical protein